MKNKSICIFNNGLFDIEIYYENFKTIKDLKNYYNDINTVSIDLKNENIFINVNNTIESISTDRCIFKSCEDSIELFKLSESEENNLLIEGEDMKKIPFSDLLNRLKKSPKNRIVTFDPIAYTTY